MTILLTIYVITVALSFVCALIIGAKQYQFNAIYLSDIWLAFLFSICPVVNLVAVIWVIGDVLENIDLSRFDVRIPLRRAEKPSDE